MYFFKAKYFKRAHFVSEIIIMYKNIRSMPTYINQQIYKMNTDDKATTTAIIYYQSRHAETTLQQISL